MCLLSNNITKSEKTKYYFKNGPAAFRPVGGAEANGPMTDRTTWVITDGKAGHVTQAMGLADAMGFDTVEKTIMPAIPWRWLPAAIWPSGVSGLGRAADSLAGAPPDLIISCGRHAVGPALWVRSRGEGHSFHIHVEHPRVDPRRFDLIASPKHDGLEGPNVIPVMGSLHRVTPQKLSAAAADLAPKLAHLPHPRVAVLIGGNNSVYRLTDAITDRLAERVAASHAGFRREPPGHGVAANRSGRRIPVAQPAVRSAV